MELVRGRHNLERRHHGCAATIGNFDGVHRGHQAVLADLRSVADELALPATVITFEPYPREFFAPERAPARLTRLRDKLPLFAARGVDRTLCLGFNAELASMSAERFVRELLVDGLGVRFLMVGDDFRFGQGRTGDYSMLREQGRRWGFRVTRMRTVSDGGERISSTRIREALARGDLASAERLLGRPYAVEGRVARGDALGRELGWPTANLRFPRRRPPLQGIYTVRVDGAGLQGWPGVASLGTRPTVDGTDYRIEVHLLDFDRDLYGRRIRVHFLEWLRDEARFDSLEALREQIARDVDEARRRFARLTHHA